MSLIDIVPIGPAESGKTCLLAAMKQGLDERDAALGPEVRAEPVTALRLGEIWRSIRADGSGWPPSTDHHALVDLRFAAGPDAEKPLYETRLVDYPGESVLDDRHPAHRALAARVRRADALLCLLDGEQVAALLGGDRDYFCHTMTGAWKLAAARGKAVRFVVTKWDLLAGRTTLAEVRAALLDLPGFAEVVRRAAVGSAGLIPVSVVGDEPGRQAVVPLLSLLAPALRVAADQVERVARRRDSLAANVGVNWLSRAVTAVVVQQVLHRALGAVTERHTVRRYAEHAAVGVSMLAEAAVRTWCDRATRSADDSGQQGRGRLLVRAAEVYEWELDEFRRRYPASDLTGAVSATPRVRRLTG